MRVRLCCTVAAMCLLSSTGTAQTGLASPALPHRPPSNPIPSVQMLPSASLPDRTPAQPIPPPRTDVFLAAPDTYGLPRPGHRRFHPFPYSFGYSPYFFASPEPRERDRRETMASGYLHLQMQPGNAQVYVDGFYMGSVDDFRRMIPGRSLQAGAHSIEVRAPGYETTTFNVVIPPNDTVTYRTDLQPNAASVKAVTVPAGVPKTFYVIPGCYAGDKPPRARLPRGCDRSKLRAVPPQPVLSVRR